MNFFPKLGSLDFEIKVARIDKTFNARIRRTPKTDGLLNFRRFRFHL